MRPWPSAHSRCPTVSKMVFPIEKIRRRASSPGMKIFWLAQKFSPAWSLILRQSWRPLREFNDWLIENQDEMDGQNGVGKDALDWFVRNALLIPYTSTEMLVLAQREFDRLSAFYALERHRNRDLPEIQLPTSREEYQQRLATPMNWSGPGWSRTRSSPFRTIYRRAGGRWVTTCHGSSVTQGPTSGRRCNSGIRPRIIYMLSFQVIVSMDGYHLAWIIRFEARPTSEPAGKAGRCI